MRPCCKDAGRHWRFAPSIASAASRKAKSPRALTVREGRPIVGSLKIKMTKVHCREAFQEMRSAGKVRGLSTTPFAVHSLLERSEVACGSTVFPPFAVHLFCTLRQHYYEQCCSPSG